MQNSMGMTVLLCGLLAHGFASSAFAELDCTAASMEELVGWAQRYGSTPEKISNREAAREAIFGRGGEALRFLLEQVPEDNETVRILLQEMVRSKLDVSVSAPILGDALADASAETRRIAAYLLGFLTTPELAPRVLPLLSDDVAGGAAARTLGKWRVRAALPAISAMLKHPKEQRRVVAANALRDIGDAQAVPVLVSALEDPIFTVRKAAARALASFGRDAERALLQALPLSQGVAQREMVRTLGALQARSAVRPLRRLLPDADAGLRRDVTQALLAIDPVRAPRWTQP